MFFRDTQSILDKKPIGLWPMLVTNGKIFRGALLWLIPYLMISAAFSVLASLLGIFLPDSSISVEVFALTTGLQQLIPLTVTCALSTMLALHWHLPRPPVVFLNMAYMVLAFVRLTEGATDHPLLLFNAIVLPFLTVPLLSYLARFNCTKIIHSNIAGENVREALNQVLPGIIVAFFVVLLFEIMSLISPLHLLDSIIAAPLFTAEPLIGGITYTACNSVLWFFGIHGYYALIPLLETLNILSAGQTIPVNESFLGSFVFIGGSGATFSLLIALLFFSKNKTFRLLALVSIPTAIFNINELLLFGIPLILNWRLFIPFLIAPITNILIAYTAASYNFFPAAISELPLNAPVLFNAFISAGINGVAIQLLCVFAGILIYAPFVRSFEYNKKHDIYFPSFDSTFNRVYEEARITTDDPVARAHNAISDYQRTTDKLQNLSHGEFFLQYQPSVNPSNNQVVGSEALLRVRQPNGSIEYPDSFLPTFEQTGFMTDIDLWVLSSISEQITSWKKKGLHLPVSINITPESLHKKRFVTAMSKALKAHPGYISIEITEHSPAAYFEEARATLSIFRQQGAKIYIDDFGSLYSSLSYLHKFPVDVIKIDRSFVLALDCLQGQKVFAGLLAFAAQLDLGVVVEGVDSESQLSFFPKNSNIVIQGWLYSKSLDADDFISFVQNRANSH